MILEVFSNLNDSKLLNTDLHTLSQTIQPSYSPAIQFRCPSCGYMDF